MRCSTIHRFMTPLVAATVLLLLAASPLRADEAGGSAPTDLAKVNAALENRAATIELATGKRIKKARHVEVGAQVTHFINGKRRDQVPTHEIVSIKAWTRHRGWKGFGIGALSGAIVGGLSEDDDRSKNDFAPDYAETTPAQAAVGGAILGGLVGAVVGKTIKSGNIIYRASTEQRLALASSSPGVG